MARSTSARRTIDFTRVVAIDTDGSNSRVLTQRSTNRNNAGFYGGAVIDWLPDDPQHVLMQTYTGAVNEAVDIGGGSNIKHPEPGLGAALVDIATGTRVQVERSNPLVGVYAADNHGNVRMRVMMQFDPAGYLRNNVGYAFRAKGSKEWLPLARVDISNARGDEFLGFDEDGTGTYVLKSLDGRRALYRIAADGSNTSTLVFAHPQVDVDGVWRIGKYRRPVAAGFAVDRNEVHYFDAKLAARAAALSKALPGHPDVTIVDESWDGAKQLLYVDGANVPGRYYLFDVASRKLGEIAAVRPNLDGVAMGAVRSVSFAAADGTSIPGFLTLPPGKTDLRGLPAIVMPHGGPSARDTAGFDWLPQFFAAQGYAVLQPNFRGSDGYGDAFFADNGFKSWALAIGDVNAGGRWLVAQGIDAKKLAIVGWSYGGYAALQANIVDPGLYRATVAVAPVTDMTLLRTEAQHSGNQRQIDAMVGDGPHLVAGSPLRNAARITAPVLLFHADRDENVLIEQSRLMAGALRGAGKRVELVEYHGLDHQIDDSDSRRDLLARSAAFLRDALK